LTRRPWITSTANPRLKRLRRLRLRRHRDAEGVFLVEGHRQLRAALEAGAAVREVYAAPSLYLGAGDELLVREAFARGAEVYELSARAYGAVASNVRPDGVLAVVARWPTALHALPLRDALLLVADGVERPGNLGAIVRTACGAGADGVLVTDAATDVFHPDAVRGSVGTLFHVPVAEATAARAVDALRRRGVTIVVATPDASQLHWQSDYTGATAIVVGSERHGVGREWLDVADEAVRIPMSDGADSLNVAVAAGILLFEAARQRVYNETYSRSR
jgi:TrmH family RNA methyltransferase